MEDREILACMRSLIAEEHWLKARRANLSGEGEGSLHDLDHRILEVSATLGALCQELRDKHRAPEPEIVDIRPFDGADARFHTRMIA